MPTVLVVDDDIKSLALVKDGLQAAGYRVVAMTSATAALDMLAREQVDAVVFEVLLPVKDGVEMMMEIMQRWPSMPILAMSGGGWLVRADQVLSIARALGACAQLNKPLNMTELVAALSRSIPAAVARLAPQQR